ncbi:hypothetical protein AVEN_63500-1 [Araneus ventricosus]|uniref:Uncharacterized protein n=1 Tax=Araneus ventricosus TaxID=182803 RepID=A0A4Y2JME5_ARAVE|nr:hypothetical protein AVEN_63500-1 [Araneus ventricosus]
MRTDHSESRRRCEIISSPVNETCVVCCSKVNSMNNESSNTISIWANFPCLIIRLAAQVLIWHLSSVNMAKSMFTGIAKCTASTQRINNIVLHKWSFDFRESVGKPISCGPKKMTWKVVAFLDAEILIASSGIAKSISITERWHDRYLIDHP